MKKLLLSVAILLSCICSLFAMPTFDSYIKDISGEYVYYRDSSFTRESYIGILTYDESSFQIRYYAPEDKVNKLPEKEMGLLLTIDPSANHWEMTGERILSQVTPDSEDIDLVNYLHDILYEFSARRGKQTDVSTTTVSSREEYNQFGGQVTINYSSLIPLFNIQSIIGSDGIPVFQCVTIGNLKNSSDPSFDNFKGIPLVTGEKKNTVKTKAGKTKKYEYNNYEISLNSTWTQGMENLWLYGNDAVISIAQIPQYSEDANMNKIYIIRKLLESRDNSYIDFENASFNLNETDNFTIKFRTFQQNENGKTQIIQNIKILTLNKDAGFDYFTFTAFLSAYNARYDYFNKVINSYKAKN